MINGLCEGMVCVKGMLHMNHPHKPAILTNPLSFSLKHPFTQNRYYVIQRMINCLCEGMVCVKGWLVQRGVMINGLCEVMVCVKGCNTENDKWFV